MKKIKAWLFRDSLELNKHWWHRLIKVVFIVLFFLITFGSFIVIFTEHDRTLLRKYNITVNNTLYDFTKNYKGDDSENTIPKFFEQKGEFGVLVDNKIEYVSSYSLGKSICVKTPEKYLDGIAKILYQDFLDDLSYAQKSEATLAGFTEKVKGNFYEDTSRRCYFFDLSIYADDLQKIPQLSTSIINYKPNIIFYAQVTFLILAIAFLVFIISAFVYYRLILYIVYGNKK